MSGFYDIAVTRIDGGTDLLGGLRGKVTLAVNVGQPLRPHAAVHRTRAAAARRCGDQNFTVVGFPATSSAAQEPGSEEEIAGFCRTTYEVTFPMSEKLEVNGPARHPVYGS